MDAGPGPGGDRTPVPDAAVHRDGVAATETARLVLAGPARRALERDKHAVEMWKQEVWPRVKAPTSAAALGAWLVFKDEAGFAMTPPRARTWGRRGQTPVVRVRGRSRRRISVPALCCYKPGE